MILRRQSDTLLEVRNRIYEFVAADKGEPVHIWNIKENNEMRLSMFKLSLAQDARESDKQDIPAGNETPSQFIREVGNYAALTRVCRQIREEFLPSKSWG